MKLDLFAIMQQEIRPALGCTEPAAVALAAAIAAKHLGGPAELIEVETDPNVYKNGMGVFLPGTDKAGLSLAAALGALAGKPELELEVLNDTASHLVQAEDLIAAGRVTVKPTRPRGTVSVLAKVSGQGRVATALIEGSHTHLAEITLNGDTTFSDKSTTSQEATAPLVSATDLKNYSIEELIAACRHLPEEAYRFLLSGARINEQLSKLGIERELGLALGYRYQELMQEGVLGKDLANVALAAAAGAADARMSGYNAPAFSTNGSGNQGIAASVPVLAVGRELKKSDAELGVALAISQTITIYIKQHIGKLSALCAAVSAGAVGAGCGIGFLLGAPAETLKETIQLALANLTGVICDGAKLSCSLKLATAVGNAVQLVLLAQQGLRAPVGEGIIATDVEETLQNLGKVSEPGMVETDNIILKLMMREPC